MRFCRLSVIILVTAFFMFLLTTNAVAVVTWEKTLGGTEDDRGHSVQQTTDGGYIVAGEKEGDSEISDVYLVKTDSFGNKVWEKTCGEFSRNSILVGCGIY